jgi:chorismate mutase
MEAAVSRILDALLSQNALSESRIVSIVFSQTHDLVGENPARALRRSEGGARFAATPLFCTQEPEYPDSLPRIVRVLLTFEREEGGEATPVYLDGAELLRPDLAGADPTEE